MKKLDEWLFKDNSVEMMARVYLYVLLPMFLAVALVVGVLEAIFMH